MELGVRLKSMSQFGHQGVVSSRLQADFPLTASNLGRMVRPGVRHGRTHNSLATADEDPREGGME